MRGSEATQFSMIASLVLVSCRPGVRGTRVVITATKPKQTGQAEQAKPSQIEAVIIIVVIDGNSCWGCGSSCVLCKDSDCGHGKHRNSNGECKRFGENHVQLQLDKPTVACVTVQLTNA